MHAVWLRRRRGAARRGGSGPRSRRSTPRWRAGRCACWRWPIGGLPGRVVAGTTSASGLTFLGLIGLVDPIRPAVPAAIRALHAAGIRTVMITGDQALTATAVARELGLSREARCKVLEAGDLHVAGRRGAAWPRSRRRIFARVPPEMKLEVVRALQANGKVVAMTGDGVNDGPALRAADVGVAMGERGTELARELADVVLSTDDFTLMVDAVEEGRLVRANVRRVLHYLLSTNPSEIWVVAGAVAIGLPIAADAAAIALAQPGDGHRAGPGAGRRAARPRPDAAPAP